MNILAKFDFQASQISGKFVFFTDSIVLTQEDIRYFWKKKYVKFIDPDDFPEKIACQSIISMNPDGKTLITFFNPAYILPENIFENPIANRSLIEGNERYGGLHLEILLPASDEGLNIHFSYQTGE